MKRLITLIIALVAITTGAWAAKTPIQVIEATTSKDVLSILELGIDTSSDEAMPNFTVKKGAPAYFDIDNVYSGWRIWFRGNWGYFKGGCIPGNWKYTCIIRIPDDKVAEYEFKNPTVTVNGNTWTVEAWTATEICATSPIFELTDTRQEISEIEATTEPDISTIPQLGVVMSEAYPTITTTKDIDAQFKELNWSKKNGDEGNWVWPSVFSSGTWRFSTQIYINSGKYKLAKSLKVKVNGVEWTVDEDRFYQGTELDALITSVYVYSPEFVIKEPRNGTMGEQGTWSFADGVLTIEYNGAMPDCTKDETDPEVAYRLQWIDFLDEIKEVVIMGVNVEIQPFFLYFEGDGPSGSHPDDHIKKVTLGAGVKSIGRQAFALYELKQFCCYSMTPPALSSDNNSEVSKRCFWKSRIEANKTYLVLRPGASANYSIANSEWMFFATLGGGFLSNLTTEDIPVGIREINDEDLKTNSDGSIYDLSGHRTDELRKGLNIIRLSDGTTKKVLVK